MPLYREDALYVPDQPDMDYVDQEFDQFEDVVLIRVEHATNPFRVEHETNPFEMDCDADPFEIEHDLNDAFFAGDLIM